MVLKIGSLQQVVFCLATGGVHQSATHGVVLSFAQILRCVKRPVTTGKKDNISIRATPPPQETKLRQET